ALARNASQPDLSEAEVRHLLEQLRALISSDPQFAEASSSESEEDRPLDHLVAPAQSRVPRRAKKGALAKLLGPPVVHQFSVFANVSRVTDIPLEALDDLLVQFIDRPI
ncbi:unnamed protein product, partial [Prorocentrum cordatum]